MNSKSGYGTPYAGTTIHDVARMANVSIGTVSKALNNQGQLSDATRARVRAVATRLQFRPNDLAQSLHRRRSFTVGLISTDRFGRFSLPILEGIEDALDPARVAVFVCKPTDNPEHERRHIEALLTKRVDGLIVTSRRTDPRSKLDLCGADVPVVYAYVQADCGDASCILPDDEGGGWLAGQHLASLGRTRVAHITGPDRFLAVRDRQRGLARALEARRLALDPALVFSGAWSEAWGYEAVGRLLDQALTFDAIFCGSDQIARGVADHLRELSVRVPQDVALVGYDNWEIVAAATRPALTTIDPCLEQLGRYAAQHLLAMIDGTVVPRGPIRVPCQLIVRDSCGGRPSLQAAERAA